MIALILLLLLFNNINSVVLRVKYPTLSYTSRFPVPSGDKAETIELKMSMRGSDCGLTWNEGVSMSQVTDIEDLWEISVDSSLCSTDVTTGATLLEVKALIGDTVWMIGSNHHVNISSSSIDTFYPWFYTTKGTLKVYDDLYSSELQNYRDVIVYMPPSYEENTYKIHENILIMHDGQNLFDPLTSAFGAWMCQDTLNELIVEGSSDEVIIVGPYNTVNRTDEYTYIYDPSEGCGGKGDLYLDWIESTLIPFTQENLRVSIVRDKLGILGSSLGGLISCYAGWTRSTVYGKVGCMSSSFWWDDNNFQNAVITASVPNDPSLPMLYMDAGTGSVGEKQCAEYTTQIYKYSVSSCGYVSEVNLKEYIDEGAVHNEASWGARFYIPVEFLYTSLYV